MKQIRIIKNPIYDSQVDAKIFVEKDMISFELSESILNKEESYECIFRAITESLIHFFTSGKVSDLKNITYKELAIITKLKTNTIKSYLKDIIVETPNSGRLFISELIESPQFKLKSGGTVNKHVIKEKIKDLIFNEEKEGLTDEQITELLCVDYEWSKDDWAVHILRTEMMIQDVSLRNEFIEVAQGI